MDHKKFRAGIRYTERKYGVADGMSESSGYMTKE
jgi:hypothetical protein